MTRPPSRRSRPSGSNPTGPSKGDKLCAVCGRRMEWRAKWASHWQEVKHCSRRCRRQGISELDRALESAILELLERRARGASICPSEAARAVDAARWRRLMERTRSAARRLAAADRLRFRQRGRVVDPSTARGPIRLSLVEAAGNTT